MPGGSKPAPRDGDASLATEVTKKAAGEPPKEPSDTPQSRPELAGRRGGLRQHAERPNRKTPTTAV